MSLLIISVNFSHTVVCVLY